jgi:predicted methyltransferase
MTLLGTIVTAQEIANEPRREKWQRVSDILAAVGAREGMVIADIGAGEGFMTVRLAAAAGPAGKVVAVDTDGSVVVALRTRLKESMITNVEVILGDPHDPKLSSESLDGAVIINAYHEMSPSVLRRVYAALKPGAKFVLCEPEPAQKGMTRSAQADDHVVDPDLIVGDLQDAGFTVTGTQRQFATNLAGHHYSLVVAERR